MAAAAAVLPINNLYHHVKTPIAAIGQASSIASPWRTLTLCSRQRVGRWLDFIKVFGLLTKPMKLFVFLALCLMALAAPGIVPEADAAASIVPTYSADQPSSTDAGSAMDCCAIGSCNSGCVPNAHCVEGCLAPAGLSVVVNGIFLAPSFSYTSIASIDPIATNLPPDPHPPRT